MAGDEKPEPWDATKNIGESTLTQTLTSKTPYSTFVSDDRLLLKQQKWRPYVDFILKCFFALILFCLNLGIDVLSRSLFLLLYGDHELLVNLDDFEEKQSETKCNLPSRTVVFDNLLYVIRPYRHRL